MNITLPDLIFRNSQQTPTQADEIQSNLHDDINVYGMIRNLKARSTDDISVFKNIRTLEIDRLEIEDDIYDEYGTCRFPRLKRVKLTESNAHFFSLMGDSDVWLDYIDTPRYQMRNMGFYFRKNMNWIEMFNIMVDMIVDSGELYSFHLYLESLDRKMVISRNIYAELHVLVMRKYPKRINPQEIRDTTDNIVSMMTIHVPEGFNFERNDLTLHNELEDEEMDEAYYLARDSRLTYAGAKYVSGDIMFEDLM